MSVFGWILLGGCSGWLANKIFGGKSLGCFGNVAVGIVGAMIGGFLFSSLGNRGITGFNIYSIFVAALGSWLLLYVISRISKDQ